jgi:hypothetical protein
MHIFMAQDRPLSLAVGRGSIASFLPYARFIPLLVLPIPEPHY